MTVAVKSASWLELEFLETEIMWKKLLYTKKSSFRLPYACLSQSKKAVQTCTEMRKRFQKMQDFLKQKNNDLLVQTFFSHYNLKYKHTTWKKTHSLTAWNIQDIF